jgi:hypothetical protein
MSKHFLLLFITIVSIASAAGCNSEVSSSSGSGGSGGGGTSGSGGSGGGQACELPGPTGIHWSFVSFDGTDVSPADIHASPDVDLQLDGEITKASPGVLTIDTCPPSANCLPMLSTLTLGVSDSPVVNPGMPLAHGIATGADVRMHFQSLVKSNGESTPVRTLHVTILNLPAWDGVENPVDTSSRLWLTVHERSADGGSNELTGAADPIAVEATELCQDELYNTIYRLDFTMPNDPPASLSLASGEQGTLTVSAGDHAGSYVVHDLRSWEYSEPRGDKAFAIVRSGPTP